MTGPRYVLHREYIHGGPDNNDEFLPYWDHNAPQQREAHYMLYEEDVTVLIDLETGKYAVVEFGGDALMSPQWRPGDKPVTAEQLEAAVDGKKVAKR